MDSVDLIWKDGRFGQTSRRDAWWKDAIPVLIAFSAFLIYANWAAWQGEHYTWGPYLSPFYSPLIFGDSEHAWFRPRPAWIPAFVSPALMILWVPGLFRFTCYYYRGAYYKAFWADPPACAVGEPRKSYLGERYFPLILQNLHRYFLYLACTFIVLLTWDVWKALWWKDAATGQVSFGIGLGTILLAVNVVFLGGYTFGCHAMRHLIGGFMDRLSESPGRLKAYACVDCLNSRHKLWAWLSLFSVGFSDVYVRCCSMGIFSDWRIL